MIKYISLRTKKYFIMKKYCFLLLFGVICSLSNIYAQNVSLDKAKCIAELFMKESTALGEEKTSVSSKHVSTFTTKDGTPSIYVFNLDGGGFVLVSAENRVKPILAYSTKGYYDASNVADGFYYTISSYNEEIEYVRNNRISATQDIISEWETVEKSGRISEKRNRTVVEPLVETTWNQNYPYNMLCPEDELGNGGHVYAGCVATAMAQVMRYWNHPVNGYNSHTYTPYGYPTQTANFSETTYNFEKMIELSKVLSAGFPHVRVDFYEVDGKLYFGELTFYHFSGFMPFEPDEWDGIFGDWLKMPTENKQ